MRVRVQVVRRPDIADPQGSTVQKALHRLGYSRVRSVRIDRTIHLEIDGEEPDEVRSQVEEMCRRLLANPVLEDVTIEVDE